MLIMLRHAAAEIKQNAGQSDCLKLARAIATPRTAAQAGRARGQAGLEYARVLACSWLGLLVELPLPGSSAAASQHGTRM
jgi:hypothetical protein